MEPVLIYCLPGHTRPVECGFTDIDADGTMRFGNVCIKPWPGSSPTDAAAVCLESTPREAYTRAIGRLVDDLRREGGKAVIARQICGAFNRFDPLGMCADYFSRFQDMFRFIFYHPAAGWWMGATPELLLEVGADNIAHTRALAGTRKIAEGSAWDAKNIDEHRIVADDMKSRVEAADPAFVVKTSESINFSYGAIEHLCTPIDIEWTGSGSMPADILLDTLHPTAAVGGFPRHKALDHIAATESYPRLYYGGTVTVRDGGRLTSYVMLRCVHFDARHWCVYSGSGITGASRGDDEWLETQAKAEPLLKLLSKF